MDNGGFERLWAEYVTRVFPSWLQDIRELNAETEREGDFSVEVLFDSMDGIRFFSLFDYQGNGMAEGLEGGGIAVISAKRLMDIYRRQMVEHQPSFLFYRTAASVCDKLKMPHVKISSARPERFGAEREAFADGKTGTVFFRGDAVFSRETFFLLCVLIRSLWQLREGLADSVLDTDPSRFFGKDGWDDCAVDAYAFGVLMMDVLFQIGMEFGTCPAEVRDRIMARYYELADELY
ncbi:MAG: hypothetical protein IKX72_00930 [Oscillospiraceae bacterium]|nr:hypothetical protein [Oscillospiraceae bacterium]